MRERVVVAPRVECSIGGEEVGLNPIGRPVNENEKTACKGDLLPRQREKGDAAEGQGA